MYESEKTETSITNTSLSHDLQTFYSGFRKFMRDYVTLNNERKDLNGKVVVLKEELSECKSLEKSHREQLLSSRNIISHLQNSVTNLITLKDDVKRMQAEVETKDKLIALMEEEQKKIEQSHKEDIERIRCEHNAKVVSIENTNDLHLAESTSHIQELKSTIQDLENKNMEKLNLIVLEYEERLQRSSAQLSQLRDQHASLAATTNANIDVYQKKISSLEEKIRTMEFENYLSRTTSQNTNTSTVISNQTPIEKNDQYSLNKLSESFPQDDSVSFSKPINKVSARRITPLHITHTKTAYPVNRFTPGIESVALNNTNDIPKKQFTVNKKRKLFSNKDTGV